jgi:hypothetical protein
MFGNRSARLLLDRRALFLATAAAAQLLLWLVGFWGTEAGDPTLPFLIPLVAFVVLAVVSLVMAIRLIGRLSILGAVGIAVYAIAFLVGSFATCYLAYGTRANWSIQLSRLDALLVALGTFTTAGTSGITPHTEFARSFVTAQLCVGIIATVMVFGLLASRLANRS